jgi:hypothetical protein
MFKNAYEKCSNNNTIKYHNKPYLEALQNYYFMTWLHLLSKCQSNYLDYSFTYRTCLWNKWKGKMGQENDTEIAAIKINCIVHQT